MTEITGGASTYIAIAKQSAKGTVQSTAAAFVFAKYLNGTDIQPIQEYLGPIREGGDGLDHRFDQQVAHRARGTLVVHGRPDIVGMLSGAFFGGGLGGNAASAWNGGSAPAIHSFQFPPGQRTTYYTVVVQHPGNTLVQVLSDARCIGLNFEAQNRQPLRITSEWIGIQMGASFGTALTPTYETGDVYGFWNASFTFPFNGSAASYVTRYAVNAQIETDPDLFAHGLVMADIVDLGRTIEVELDEIYQNASNYMFIEYKGGVSPTFTLATGVFKISHVLSTTRSMTLDANLVRFGDTRLTAIDPDNKVVYAQHSAIAFAGATSSLVSIQNNGHASNYLA